MSLTNLLRDYCKRKSIRLYLTRLRPLLGRRFGKKEYYQPEEVRQAAIEAKLPMEDLYYGVAVFCTPEDFEVYYRASGEKHRYWKIRQEFADRHFGGNSAFTPDDVISFLRSYSEAGPGPGDIPHLGNDSGGHGHHGHH